jgi:hypothetical protein
MAKAKKTAKSNSTVQTSMIFGPRNYTWLAVGVLAIIVGFTAMRIENEIRGFISLYAAPIVILAGFSLIVWAIYVNPEPDSSKESHNEENG